MKRSKNCLYCKNLVYKKRTVSLRFWALQKYCSTKCLYLSRKKPLKEYERTCQQCLKHFFIKKPCMTRKFCSPRCSVLSQTGKKRTDLVGENHPNWQGGKTKIQEALRKSIEYQQWRKAVFGRDGYKCIECGDDRGGNLEADHIKPFATNPSLRFDVNNGRTLCHSCHVKTDTYLTGGWRDKRTGRFISNFI